MLEVDECKRYIVLLINIFKKNFLGIIEVKVYCRFNLFYYYFFYTYCFFFYCIHNDMK